MLVQELAILAGIIKASLSAAYLAASVFWSQNSVLPNVFFVYFDIPPFTLFPDIRRNEIPDGKMTEQVANGVD
jgi:hypothetical protein